MTCGATNVTQSTSLVLALNFLFTKFSVLNQAALARGEGGGARGIEAPKCKIYKTDARLYISSILIAVKNNYVHNLIKCLPHPPSHRNKFWPTSLHASIIIYSHNRTKINTKFNDSSNDRTIVLKPQKINKLAEYNIWIFISSEWQYYK